MDPAEELVTLSFEAVMEDNHTKTALSGSLEDAYRNLTWLPTDTIAIATSSNYSTYYKFSNVNTEPSEVGNFIGEAPLHDTYYSVYPYSAVSSWWDYGRQLNIHVPVKQVYAENTFATDMNPMVARAPRTEVLQFKNLCGLLAVSLTGNDVVKSITLAAYDESGALASIAGSFRVNMDYEDSVGPELAAESGGDGRQKSAPCMIQMDCGDGVQLSETATSFHFVLAPGEYSKIAIIVTTTDGKIMMREGKNPLTIKRAEWVAAGTLQYVENVSFDLSDNGYANCYVVPEAGVYSFDASVIGNGEFGIIPNAGFHTDDPTISPVYAEILWEDRPGIVAGTTCGDGRISFVATGIEGNALIAAKDEAGSILWSWHIWSVNDNVDDLEYVNSIGTYTVQDRNLGALRNDRGTGDEWKDAMGVYYQWGRKDPFIAGAYSRNYNKQSIATSIANPTCHYGEWYGWEETDSKTYLWSPYIKTIYDPCPVGYKVTNKEIWQDFTLTKSDSNNPEEFNISGSHDRGLDFYYDAGKTTYYPANDLIDYYGNLSRRDNAGDVWSSEASSGNRAYRWNYEYYENSQRVQLWYAECTSYALPVRCMKDDHTVPYVISMSGISGITLSGASVSGYVSVYGNKTVSSRGFVYGTSSDLTVDNAAIVLAGEGTGTYTADITELESSTKYYVRAVALVDDEIVYSDASAFTTPDASGIIDLSSAGTANCYMISQPGTYKFNATVRGNGAAFKSNKSDATAKANEEKTAIKPDKVKVVWETLNTSDAVTEGAVVASVSLADGYVTFTTPENFTPGNALIAVTAAGKVVWSWHIWAVDCDAEADAQIYQNGAMMMDRNLGALTVTAGDVRSYGLFYQWGRKDPFFGSGDLTNNTFAASYPVVEGSNNAIVYMDNNASYDNFSYALMNPNHFIKYSNWNDDEGYWANHKTMYDPCPVGWRVADREAGVWDGFSVSRVYYGAYFSAPLSTPSAYYPHTGYINGNGGLNSVNSITYLWTSPDRYTFRVNTTVGMYDWNDRYNGNPVRCMRDAEFNVTTLEEIQTISDTYAVVIGNLDILDATVMDVKGFVFSNTTSDLKLGNEGCFVADAENALDGDMAVTLTGLKPNTRYYYRAYARGAYNTRYGTVREFWTKAAGDVNEGFGSEDFDWAE